MTFGDPFDMPESAASFTALAAAIKAWEAVGTDPETLVPIRLMDLKELLRRQQRAFELRDGAAKKCETIRRWWLNALRNGSSFDPSVQTETQHGTVDVSRDARGVWVVTLDGDELHSGGVPEHAYVYYCGLLTGMQYSDEGEER